MGGTPMLRSARDGPGHGVATGVTRRDDDALGVRRAVVLTHAAARAAFFLHHDAIAVQFQRGRAHRALVDADRTVLADRAIARLLAPARGPHVDVLDRNRA